MAHPAIERKPETIGRRLASRRALFGISQADAAERLGVSQDYISRLENDKAVPDVTIAAKLAELYGVSLDYLVNGVAA